MMNGQLGTGCIEGVWSKLKGLLPAKRTFTMLIMACLRVASELSNHAPIFRDKIDKSFDELVREQLKPKGKRRDDATYGLLKLAHQKLSWHAINEIEKRLLLLANVEINHDHDVLTERTRTGEYQFQVRRHDNGKWVCHAVEGGGMCWKNRLFGLPCVHILKVWAEELKYYDVEQMTDFRMADMEASVHKVYLRSTYLSKQVKLQRMVRDAHVHSSLMHTH